MSKPALALLAVFLATGCGYHVAGKADLLPKNIKTIAVPAFANITVRYKISERLPADITREFLSRTRYKVVADPNQADAVLSGAVVNYLSYPTVFDPITNRTTGILVIVALQVNLTERATGKVLFSRPHMEVRERYEISVNPQAYFDESDAALDRVSKDAARMLVSAVLEKF
jgi:Lipopolysaccharide-assembly